MSRIVVITHGSLGDLSPYAAVALGLKKRGHKVILGTCPCHEQKVKSLGLEFRPVEPDCEWLSDPDQVRHFTHPRFGLMRVGREIFMPKVRESYEQTLQAADGADLLVTMLASYASRLVAEKTGLPWVSGVHIPMGFFSARDVPVLEMAPTLCRKLRGLGPPFWKPVYWLGKRISRGLAKPWYQLRAELGLPPTREGNPLSDSHSPHLVLALFSERFAAKQTDWPAQTVQTGFPFLEDDTELPEDLSRFLDKGPRPLVFTLGTAVVASGRSFYETSIESASRLGERAVLVVGKGQRDLFASLPPGMIAVESAPFGKLFPRSLAVVHHGGVGTTALAMLSGRPMLVVPFAWDQPDHADRVARLGIARTIPKKRYTPARAIKELQQLLDDPEYVHLASQIRGQLQQETGVESACDSIENVELRRSSDFPVSRAAALADHEKASIH